MVFTYQKLLKIIGSGIDKTKSHYYKQLEPNYKYLAVPSLLTLIFHELFLFIGLVNLLTSNTFEGYSNLRTSISYYSDYYFIFQDNISIIHICTYFSNLFNIIQIFLLYFILKQIFNVPEFKNRKFYLLLMVYF